MLSHITDVISQRPNFKTQNNVAVMAGTTYIIQPHVKVEDTEIERERTSDTKVLLLMVKV